MDTDSRQAGIEITDEMVEAGLDELLAVYPETIIEDALDRKMVKRIFTAMISASRVDASQVDKFS